MKQVTVFLSVVLGFILAGQRTSVEASNVKMLTEKVPLELGACKQLGYTETSKVNFMKQTQAEAKEDSLYKSLLLLDKTGCSALIKGFACATYAPRVLAEYGTALPPCRSLCKRTEGACKQLIWAMATMQQQGECKMTGKGGEYRGTISTTRKGVKCQRWDEHFPHRHDSITPKKYPNSGLDENYCRNPDGEGLPWCYTSSNEQRWDYCDVPMCKNQFYCDYFPEPSPKAACVDYKVDEITGKLVLSIKGNPTKGASEWRVPRY